MPPSTAADRYSPHLRDCVFRRRGTNFQWAWLDFASDGINNDNAIAGHRDGGPCLWLGGKALPLAPLIHGREGWKFESVTAINDRYQIIGNGEFRAIRRRFC